jgi:TRAP-type mannitol/chloroaromatic compound transport system permease small subunit
MDDWFAGFARVIAAVDRFTNWVGIAVSWLLVPLILGVTYEVIARYLFNAPTIWAFDLTYMLYGAVFMLGASYTLMKGGHIRTDMLWENYSDRRKGWVDLLAYVLFFFPALLMIFFTSVDDAWYSFQIGERSEQTAWRPIIYPFKAVVPLTALLLLIQGVSEFLKSLYAVRTGRLYSKIEKIEV